MGAVAAQRKNKTSGCTDMTDNEQTHKLPTGDKPSAQFSNPVLENIYARRSNRNYTPEPVRDQILLELIRAGIYAPTARNQQAWRFVVVTNKEEIDKYADRTKQLWQKYLPLKVAAILGIGGKELSNFAKMLRSPSLHLFHHAPALVFIFAPKGRLVAEDCSCAAENMMLAAKSLGIGSCWIGFAGVLGSDKKTLSELKIPKGYKLMATVVFGYPKNETTKAPARNEDVILRWVE
jgi:nitroreductase